MARSRTRRSASPKLESLASASATQAPLVDEPQLWATVASVAGSAFDFWNAFLNLQRGNLPLDASGISAFKCITRAVSWVESKHGTAGSPGNFPARDPIQCGNPGDAWWTELIDPGSQTDRFIGGPTKPNYWAGELPSAAGSNPQFPANALLSSLGNQADGHKDTNFAPPISYYWGIPYLIHRTNTAAGDKTYQCGDVSRARLVDGAVAYNGGGDPSYRQKINDALDMIGCLQSVEVPEFLPETPATLAQINGVTEAVLARVVAILKAASEADAGTNRLLFPDGINLIDLKVKVGSIEVDLTVSGKTR